jgi:hypothetical protein
MSKARPGGRGAHWQELDARSGCDSEERKGKLGGTAGTSTGSAMLSYLNNERLRCGCANLVSSGTTSVAGDTRQSPGARGQSLAIATRAPHESQVYIWSRTPVIR